MNAKTKKLTMLAMLCAIAFVIVAVCRIPIIPSISFLKYEPKDVIITTGGFLFGPLSALLISTVVSLIEMVTISESGIIGAMMNILASCSFACIASIIYKRDHTLRGGIIGLALGALAMTAVMLAWNYFLTPLYMGRPREEVAAMLLPIFLPFNLLKGGLNMLLTLMVYKPVANALRRARLVELPTTHAGKAL